MPRFARGHVVLLGVIALLGLSGVLRALPGQVAFFAGSIAVILFPGAALRAIRPALFARMSLPGMLAVWSVLGIALLSLFGVIGLALKAKVSDLTWALAAGYACLVIAAAASRLRRGRTAPAAPGPAARGNRHGVRITIVVLALATAAGLLTLVTPRDVDDWYYLAYIRDFASDHPLRAEDSIAGPGQPASPRIWYASWWVVEAALSRLAGVDPVAGHQVYLPILILPFMVLAVFAFARQVFRDDAIALVACLFQVLFYLSSAFPYNSPGWLVFCRAAQDKAVGCFLMAPVVVALALKLMNERSLRDPAPAGLPPGSSAQGSDGRPEAPPRAWGAAALYGFALLGATLVHPLSVAWVAVAVAPCAVVETLLRRRRRATVTLALVVLPLVVLGGILGLGAGGVSSALETRAAAQTEAFRQPEDRAPGAEAKRPRRSEAARPEARLYLPGEPFPRSAEEGDFSTVIRHHGDPVATNPSYIIRYPLAIAGLAAALLLIAYTRSDPAARYLVVTTLAILLLAFTPGVAAIAARALTWKMIYRLGWMLPWGFALGSCASRLRLPRLSRSATGLLVLLVTALALARGDPANYVRSLLRWTQESRPQPQAVAALAFLGGLPTPQGTILASPGIAPMIAAFLPDAYPASFRGAGPISRQRLAEILALGTLTPDVAREIMLAQATYVLIEKGRPLSQALRGAPPGFTLIYENDRYEMWSVPATVDR
jgi:hypothetical protein